jgi:hypothetical protein
LQAVSNKFSLFDEERPAKAGPLHRKLLAAASPLILNIGTEPWLRENSFDSLHFPFARKRRLEGRVVDLLSEPLLKDQALGRTLILDSGRPREMYQSGPDRTVRSRDMVHALANVASITSFIRLLPLAEEECRYMAPLMRREFGIGEPISKFRLARRVAFFSASRRLFRNVIQRSGAKRLFMAGRPGTSGSIAAAQDLGIPTAELQHGIVTPYHVGYHYPNRPFVPYAPSHFMTFGKFWTEKIELPRNTTAITIGSGNPAHNLGRSKTKIPRNVVAISQGTIGARLFQAISQAAEEAPDWSFVFRPHPWEDFGTYKAKIAARTNGNKNLRISDESEDFYALLGSADVQIGVYSTAVFEGMAMGARTIILALPGAEHMAQAVALGDAVLAESQNDVARLLSIAPSAAVPERYFSEPVQSIVETVFGSNTPW